MEVEVSGQMDPFAQTLGHEDVPIAPHDIRYKLHIDSTELAERLAALHL